MALALALFSCMSGVCNVCDVAQRLYPENFNGTLATGLYPVINVAILGLLVYLVSVIMRIALKPRI